MSANEKRTEKVFGWLIKFFGVLVILSAVAGIYMPVPPGLSQKSPATKAFSSAKQLGIACKLYASDHEGKFPDRLHDLVQTHIIDEATFKRWMFIAVDPVEKGWWGKYMTLLGIKPNPNDYRPSREWSYYGAEPNLTPDSILISSPVAIGKRRIVVYASISGEIIREEEFQKQIKAQLQAASNQQPPAPVIPGAAGNLPK